MCMSNGQHQHTLLLLVSLIDAPEDILKWLSQVTPSMNAKPAWSDTYFLSRDRLLVCGVMRPIRVVRWEK